MPCRRVIFGTSYRRSFGPFDHFPEEARSICLAALTIAAEGGKADVAKPLHGVGSGVFEIALPFRGDVPRGLASISTRNNSVTQLACFGGGQDSGELDDQ